jgi:hypothetical protein
MGANTPVFYVEKRKQLFFARIIQAQQADKAPKDGAFCIEKIPTKRIIS